MSDSEGARGAGAAKRPGGLVAFLLGFAVGFAPFAWWAHGVDATQLDPELPAAAWVFALWAGGGTGMVVGLILYFIHRLFCGRSGASRAPRQGAR